VDPAFRSEASAQGAQKRIDAHVVIAGTSLFGCLKAARTPKFAIRSNNGILYAPRAESRLGVHEAPGRVEVIGSSALKNCSDLELCECLRPSKLGRIESRAFFGYSLLRSMDFPASLPFLGVASFAQCSDLSTLIFDSGWSLEAVVGGLLIEDFLSETVLGAISGSFWLEPQGWSFRSSVRRLDL
jgi:hypothetical protein